MSYINNCKSTIHFVSIVIPFNHFTTFRSVPANASDAMYCMLLAQNAVHGVMAGFTAFTTGLVNNRMVYIPIKRIVATSPRVLDPQGRSGNMDNFVLNVHCAMACVGRGSECWQRQCSHSTNWSSSMTRSALLTGVYCCCYF